MTIITKPFADAKKSEKLILPLVGGNNAPSAPLDSTNQNEDRHVSSVIMLRQARRASSGTTLVLFLIALLVTSMGILGGICYYRQLARSASMNRRFYGVCQIPYDPRKVDNSDIYYLNSLYRDENQMIQSALQRMNTDNIFKPFENKLDELSKQILDDNNNSFFKEGVEVDEEENYSKIQIPSYRDGRKGKFLHDFKYNQSGIIDKDASRCFLMDLDRDTVLPPSSLRDLIEKMWNGYYDIDTEVIRKNMRVITPEMEDLSSVSPRITKECENMKIYQLEKFQSGVYKRSADLHHHAKYAEFGGHGIVEIDIQNLEDIDAAQYGNLH